MTEKIIMLLGLLMEFVGVLMLYRGGERESILYSGHPLNFFDKRGGFMPHWLARYGLILIGGGIAFQFLGIYLSNSL